LRGAILQEEPDPTAPDDAQVQTIARRRAGEYILAEAVLSLIHLRKAMSK
jgi:hypothetical protein